MTDTILALNFLAGLIRDFILSFRAITSSVSYYRLHPCRDFTWQVATRTTQPLTHSFSRSWDGEGNGQV